MFEVLGLFAGGRAASHPQVLEPQLYGHSTGLSPLSVVVAAAIFWSWIWGPVGLVVSTPLTLCLVVGGRHLKGLQFLDILLGDAPALSMSRARLPARALRRRRRDRRRGAHSLSQAASPSRATATRS